MKSPAATFRKEEEVAGRRLCEAERRDRLRGFMSQAENKFGANEPGGARGEGRAEVRGGSMPSEVENLIAGRGEVPDGRIDGGGEERVRIGFWALIVTQFQVAFSDNALKWLVSFLVLESAANTEYRDFLFVLVVPMVFAIPFLIFSIPGGYFADRFSKRSVTISTKLLEVVVMCGATYALWVNRLDLAAVALFFACMQGAIFGPSKYGLMPELLPVSKLSWGNGVIELWTLVAAIFGTLAGGFLAHHNHGQQVWSGIFLVALSIVGLCTSFGITLVPAADPGRAYSWNWGKEFVQEIQRIRRDAILWVAVIANTFFWFLGAMLLLNIVLYATDILQVDEAHSSYLLAVLSLGIGVGSFVAGYASGRKIEMGMILPGLTGIVLLTAALSVPGLRYAGVMALLAGLGMCAGFFVVPVNALIQNRPRPEVKGRVIGASNLLSFGGIALQPLVQYAMLRLGHPDAGRVFLICAGACVAMVFVLARMLPELWPSALYWTRLRQRASL